MKNAFDYPYCRFQIIVKVITYKDMLKESAKQSAVSTLSAKAPFQCPIAQVPECLECLSAQASFEFPSAQVPQVPRYPDRRSTHVPYKRLECPIAQVPFECLKCSRLECLVCLECPSASVSHLVSQPISQLV